MSKHNNGVTDKFWLVWRLGGGQPTKMHGSADAAKDEAERLAEKLPGERFAVLQAMEVYIATINPPQALKCLKPNIPAKF